MSLMSFYINQLENFDPRFNNPLFSVTWSRDVDLRGGVTVETELTSYVRNTYGATGSQQATGLPYLAENGTSLPGISVDNAKITTPVRLLGQQICYSKFELLKSQRTGQSIDMAKMTALNSMYQMSTDQVVYIGDTGVYAGFEGLLNNSSVTNVDTVADGASTDTFWSTKTPDEILADVNEMLNSAYEASGFSVCPNKILLPHFQYSLICSTKVSAFADKSIITYVQDNSISTKVNGSLDIRPVKWLPGLGVGDTDRMIAYTKSEEFLRFPMAPMMSGEAWVQGFDYFRPYAWAYGQIELIYPETIAYRDGI